MPTKSKPKKSRKVSKKKLPAVRTLSAAQSKFKSGIT